MSEFAIIRAEGAQVHWRQLEPGDERHFCRLFARWPSDPARPTLGSWPAGDVLTYADCFAAISAQLAADTGLDYTTEPADGEVRALVSETAGCIVSSERFVIASSAGDPFLDAVDVQAYLVALGVRGSVSTLVGDGGAGAWASRVNLRDWEDALPAFGWVERPV
ncbi:MAG: hypothetical protein OXG72_18160 [Acidobacteria bacterium]|nr:hypothetical protein [Acidobacteriota bacterium]